MSEDQIWLLARTATTGTVVTWYGYWDSEEEAEQYAQSNAEGGDGTPCENLCDNKASWFHAEEKTPEEIRELSHIRVKQRTDGVPDEASEAGPS